MATVVEHRWIDVTTVVRENQAGVWRWLRFLGCDDATADDLTQETFLQLLRKPQSDWPEALPPYLRGIARNRYLMWLRAKGRRRETADLDLLETVWQEVDREDGLQTFLDALQECLGQSGERVREAVRLHYAEGNSREQIATALGLKPEGVKTLLRRTRAALRKCIEGKLAE